MRIDLRHISCPPGLLPLFVAGILPSPLLRMPWFSSLTFLAFDRSKSKSPSSIFPFAAASPEEFTFPDNFRVTRSMTRMLDLVPNAVDADFHRLDEFEDDTDGRELEFSPPSPVLPSAANDVPSPTPPSSPLSVLSSLSSDSETNAPESSAPQPVKKRRKRTRTQNTKKQKAAAAAPDGLSPDINNVFSHTTPDPLEPMAAPQKQPSCANRMKTACRRKQRALKHSQPQNPDHFKIRSKFSKRSIGLGHHKINVTLSSLPVAKGAFIGVRTKTSSRLPTIDELRNEGLEIVEWDGM